MDHSLTQRQAPRVGAIIQARMGSSRLPGKALLPLPLASEVSLLARVIERALRADITTVIVATTTLGTDDEVAAVAAAAGAKVFRGSEQDVLARFYEAATASQLDTVVRLTADNPAIDPCYINLALAHHHQAAADYTMSTGLPLGTNLEIIRYEALQQAHNQALLTEEREHVTPYIRRHQERFNVQEIDLAPENKAWASYRLTVDYPSDYALLQLLYSSLPPDFSLADVDALYLRYPWLPQINAANQQIRVV
ncbi:NTP transferase domain-containing protein [Hymenobacter lutimineralis]|uniref:NTP transferase domain-containing protein n=1 Tax=Hymenobacter lutimineralis TaxID=2606448 RepID=A0A5D6V5M7_9BACT|nr:NTP transferase domain-containing protein [Hymenobacter lutimineralis]TYZ10547.1 NTP transferase domain-containing protein [Hymenobacter lutimineralis]